MLHCSYDGITDPQGDLSRAMSQAPEIAGTSIVSVGRFNPSIFHPAWFTKNDLLPPEEAAAARVEFVAPQAARFETDWLRCQVTLEQLSFSTTATEQREALRDLFLGTFELLRHTPMFFLGINNEAHFKMSDKEVWDGIGHALTPKDLWTQFLDRPGLRSISIQGERSDGRRGYVLVSVEPSQRIDPGIYVRLNDHFDLRPEGSSEVPDRPQDFPVDGDADAWLMEPSPFGQAEEAVKILSERWEDSMELSETTMTNVLSWR
jgi:hypothetical protein